MGLKQVTPLGASVSSSEILGSNLKGGAVCGCSLGPRGCARVTLAFPAAGVCLGCSREGQFGHAQSDPSPEGDTAVGAASRQQGLHSAGEVTGWGDSCSHNLGPGAHLFQ